MKDPLCGISKGCIDNCPSPTDCVFQVTWVPNLKASNVMFELAYKTDGKDDRWAAIGFSHDQKMVGYSPLYLYFNYLDSIIAKSHY